MKNAKLSATFLTSALLISGVISSSQVRAAARSTAPAAPDVATAAAHEAAKGDTLLEALLTELDRSKAQLKMDQVQAPYYIEYRVNDVDEFAAEAAFGAIRE